MTIRQTLKFFFVFLALAGLVGCSIFSVEPGVPVTGLSLSETTQDLVVGTTWTLEASVSPANASSPEVVWKSSAAEVATVDQTGLVTALSPGITTILVTSVSKKSIYAACEVTVTQETSGSNVLRTLTLSVIQGSGTLAGALGNASVTLGSTTIKSSSLGAAVFHVADGSHTYSVSKPGYTTVNGSIAVSGVDATKTVTLGLQRQPSSSTDSYSPGPGWTLSWSDEFNSPTLDAAKWAPQVLEAGHFNNELQSYTASRDNAFITNRSANDGVLVIQALKTGTGIAMGDFTSARLITHPNGSWLYGKIAARLQVPFGQGLWPAFWMLGSNISENAGGTTPWPQSGEIDIMEKRGGTPAKERETSGAFHYANAADAWNYQSASKSLANPLSDDFHVYEVEWNATSLTWRIDGSSFFTVSITDPMYDEFRKSFYILLNVAVGGSFDNGFDGTATFPQSMFIDWVRVYQ